ncbi:MAG TPA: acetate/propionate family kinase [Ktedonobacterales bacterium]|nr:acetate/propionate family kinase [Ktedonobacterales bacterium]
MPTDMTRVLALNSGSSSLKFALYAVRVGADEQPVASGQLAPIGGEAGQLTLRDMAGGPSLDQRVPLPTHAAALRLLLETLSAHAASWSYYAVGHRVVHGGADFSAPTRITSDVIRTLQGLIPLAPEHLPQAISIIEAVADAHPAVPQVACFDTAFHHAMPAVARTYALPRALTEGGRLRRYGFHGLSYESICAALERQGDHAAAGGRLVIAHLGNGASLCAVRAGHSVDTTMGFSPSGGLVMGTRTGDLDPGVVLYLLELHHLTTSQVRSVLNHESGLLALSAGARAGSADVRELLAREADDPAAALALAVFCYQAKRHLGALVAVLGGLDALVFTGGIGEHASAIRARICDGLGVLGIELDAARNAAGAPVISSGTSAVTVRVMATEEERMIARHTAAVLRTQHAPPPPGE